MNTRITCMRTLRMCSHSIEAVLLKNVFSYYRMCSRTTECLLIQYNVFSYPSQNNDAPWSGCGVLVTWQKKNLKSLKTYIKNLKSQAPWYMYHTKSPTRILPDILQRPPSTEGHMWDKRHVWDTVILLQKFTVGLGLPRLRSKKYSTKMSALYILYTEPL